MNKPAKLLVAVAVLAFAAAGLYYAWLAPAKKASTTMTTQIEYFSNTQILVTTCSKTL